MLQITAFILFVLCVSARVAKPDIIVAKDGSGNFKSLQAAINSIPANNNQEKIILVKQGRYTEKVKMKQAKVTIIGEGNGKSVIQWGDNAAKAGSTPSSATFETTGSDVKIYKMTFVNSAPWPTAVGGQAVAFSARGGRTYVEDSKFYSYQDTLLTYYDTQYYKNCYIEGQVDFIFGLGLAVFDRAHIHAVAKGTGTPQAYITADGNRDPQYKKGGILIQNSIVTAQKGVATFLGRTWGSHAHALFTNTYLPDEARGAGWLQMGTNNAKTVRVGEFKNNGPGANQAGRASFAHKFRNAPSAASFLGTERDTAWMNPEKIVLKY